jgi:hypothetical protein
MSAFLAVLFPNRPPGTKRASVGAAGTAYRFCDWLWCTETCQQYRGTKGEDAIPAVQPLVHLYHSLSSCRECDEMFHRRGLVWRILELTLPRRLLPARPFAGLWYLNSPAPNPSNLHRRPFSTPSRYIPGLFRLGVIYPFVRAPPEVVYLRYTLLGHSGWTLLVSN